MDQQENIVILKSIGQEVSDKLHCDRHGSCVHFAEIFVEEVNDQYPELLYDFDVIEGYVKVKFGNGIPQEHTWIRLNNGDIIDPTFLQFNKYDSNAEYSKKRTKVYSGQEYYDEGKGGSWFSEKRKKLPSTVFKEGKKESIRRILIKETEKLNPFVLRRIDLDKFESLLNKGKVYMFYESNSLEEFKWKLVTANLENYIYYKYDIEIDLSDSVYDSVIEYLVNLYNNKLESMYNNLIKERGLTESILNEVTNPMLLIFRRVPQEKLDKEFESSLNYISRLFIKNYKSNPRKLSEQEFTRMVAIDLIQMLDFRNIFPNDVEWYEDVIKALINHYDDRISTMYNVLKK